MSKLKELIDRLCPDGVPFKPLGKVASYIRGVTYNITNIRNQKRLKLHHGIY